MFEYGGIIETRALGLYNAYGHVAVLRVCNLSKSKRNELDSLDFLRHNLIRSFYAEFVV